MKLRRILSCMMALLLVCGLPVSALAEEYDLAKGSITVTADESGQYVTQADNGIINHKEESDTVITQTDSETSTTNTVTITAEKGAEANVTLSGVNIDVGGTGDYEIYDPGEAAVRITGEGDVTMELDGENTVQGGYLRAGVEKNDADSSGNLTITDENGTDGSLEATGGVRSAGIGGGDNGSGSDITITGSAKVTAQGGTDGAGIGGGNGGSGSEITITGSAEVTANGGTAGSGIGGGGNGSGSNITISGSAQVEATGGLHGSGIGGGYNHNGTGTGSNITVSGDAQVKAQGGNAYYSELQKLSQGAGAAIGNGGGDTQGYDPNFKGEDAEVTTDAPQAGDSYGLYVGELNEGWVATYAPGEDMDTANPGSLTYQGGIKVPGAVPVAKLEPTCTEPGHEAGYKIGDVLVAVTIPATGHNVPSGTPNGDATCTTLGTMTGTCTNCNTEVTVPDPNYAPHTFTTYTPDPGNLATCTEAGTKTAVCDVCHNATDTVTDPAKDHSMGDFTTYKAATCTEAGEEQAYCTNNCGYYETREIPELGHSFKDYKSDGNATCTEDGTKTAKCDNGCGETDTVTDEGSALGHSFTDYIFNKDATYTEDGTKTAKCDHEGCDVTDTIPDPDTKLPCYQVKGQDGKDIPHQDVRQDGVLTITVDADYAILTGTLGGIQALKAQGIDTIVFVTNGASSTFALSDLLEQGSTGDSYKLTHDGETVSFTLGEKETDVTDILVKP